MQKTSLLNVIILRGKAWTAIERFYGYTIMSTLWARTRGDTKEVTWLCEGSPGGARLRSQIDEDLHDRL